MSTIVVPVLRTAQNLLAVLLNVSSSTLYMILNSTAYFGPIYTYSTFLIGFIAINLMIAFWFPTYKGLYSQTNPSAFSSALITLSVGIKSILSFSVMLFVYTPIFYAIALSLMHQQAEDIFYYSANILMFNVMLYVLIFLCSLSTKWDYSDSGGSSNKASENALSSIFGGGSQLEYCVIDDTSKDDVGTDGEYDPTTCRRTRWQSIRDSLLQSGIDYFSSLSLSNALFSRYPNTLMAVILGSFFLAALSA